MTQAITDRVNCADVLRLAGFTPPSDVRKRMCCPLHNDRSPSFKLVGPNRGGFVCYGCNSRGGILDLTVRLGLAADRATALRFLQDRFP